MSDGFHWRDGWIFARLTEGTVRIQRGEVSLEIPETEWASIVCSVSSRGENATRWQEARFFHGAEDARYWNHHSQKWEWNA